MANGDYDQMDPELLSSYLGLDRLDNDEALAQDTALSRAKALRAFNPGHGPSALGGLFRGIQQIASAAKAKGLENSYRDEMQNDDIKRQAGGLDIVARIAKLRQAQAAPLTQPGQPGQPDQPPPTGKPLL